MEVYAFGVVVPRLYKGSMRVLQAFVVSYFYGCLSA